MCKEKSIQLLKKQLSEAREYLAVLKNNIRDTKYSMRRMRIKLAQLRYEQDEAKE